VKVDIGMQLLGVSQEAGMLWTLGCSQDYRSPEFDHDCLLGFVFETYWVERCLPTTLLFLFFQWPLHQRYFPEVHRLHAEVAALELKISATNEGIGPVGR
jgi:hypothetical protein